MANGGSQARGPIRATVAGLHHSHSNTRLSLVCDLSLVCLAVPFFFLLFRATFSAHGGSQSRGQVVVTTAGLHQTAAATQDLSCVFDIHQSSWQRWILSPLSKAGDQTRNLMVGFVSTAP